MISGAINGESALTIRTTQLAVDSRYAKIMQVMRESESESPAAAAARRSTRCVLHARGAGVALLAWAISGESIAFWRCWSSPRRARC